jgi:hypothetical protein
MVLSLPRRGPFRPAVKAKIKRHLKARDRSRAEDNAMHQSDRQAFFRPARKRAFLFSKESRHE